MTKQDKQKNNKASLKNIKAQLKRRDEKILRMSEEIKMLREEVKKKQVADMDLLRKNMEILSRDTSSPNSSSDTHSLSDVQRTVALEILSKLLKSLPS